MESTVSEYLKYLTVYEVSVRPSAQHVEAHDVFI